MEKEVGPNYGRLLCLSFDLLLLDRLMLIGAGIGIDSPWEDSFRPSKSSSKNATTKMTTLTGSMLRLRYAARSIVIELITTGVTGLSCAPFFTLEILSATS